MFTPLSIHKFRTLPVLFAATVLFFGANAAVATPALPIINTNNIVNVTSFGAVGDGVTTNTIAIQNAINAASAGGLTNGATGGTVEFPAGIFLCGPITLKSAVNIQLENGAILRMLPFGQYPVTWHTNGSAYYFTASNFLSGSSLHDFEISGTGWIQGQGEPWWPWANTNGAVRPVMISLSGCHRTLITSVTLSNSPEFHIACGTSCGDTTVQGVTIRANSSSDPANPGHNTDACDASGTNTLVQNCNISVGDDDYTCGGNSGNILITNNTYGAGHGTSIGSYTSPSVSNLTIVNCTYTNTDAGIRIKTDRDRGGYVHDLTYYNLTMSQVKNAILIYTEYTNTVSMYRAVDSISPAVAASYPGAPVTSTTPHYRNITISNLTATAQSGRAAGLIWGLPEASVSNATLVNVHLTDTRTFGIYDAQNVRIIDCTHSVSSGVSQYSFFNSDITFSNSTPATSAVLLDGATTNGIANKLSFYNALMSLAHTNAIDLNSSITLSASTFTINNNLALTPSNTVNFILGTNAATMIVNGNLALGGTNNIIAGAGFTNGTYTLFTYTGTLAGNSTLGTTPADYNYSLDTSTPGRVNLIVSSPAPAIPANLTDSATNLAIGLQWSTSTGAASYNLKRSTINGGPYSMLVNLPGTNFSDTAVNPGVTYYYVVSATNAVAESGNSSQVSGAPLPSLVSTNISFQANGNQLQLSWPADHLGWHLQVQTNPSNDGLGTNWVDVPDTSATNQYLFSVDTNNATVFWRLAYP